VTYGAGSSSAGSAAVPAVDRKVMVIAFENETHSAVLGSASAPYLTAVSRHYGTATHMDAGYPIACPSLAGYLLITSGSRYGICDDDPPSNHRLSGDNVFRQVVASGRSWRAYAEHLPTACPTGNRGTFAVRHVPSAYYTSEATRCRTRTVELGTAARGALHSDVVTGRLPSYSFVTPDLCHDMHGLRGVCPTSIALGDRWLKSWLPQVVAGPDYRAGRLVVIVTFDEGSSSSNRIPTVVLSPRTKGLRAATPFTHCSTLRTTEELLGLPLLRCARTAPSMRSAFRL
jgi:hypothetical protein